MNAGAVVQWSGWYLGIALAVPACSSRSSRETTDPPDGGGAVVCEASLTQSCTGPGACQGAQVCAGDGSRWSACVCGSTAGGGAGLGGGASAGGTGAQASGGAGNSSASGGSGTTGGAGGNAGSGSSGGVGAGGGSGPTGGNGGSDNGGCTDTELLNNPGFDLGFAGWDTETDSTRPVIVAASESPIAPHSAPNLVWFGGYDFADAWISQTFTVTVPNASLILSFYVFIETLEEEAEAYDVLVIQTEIGSDVLSHLTLSNAHAAPGYQRFSVDLPPALAGTTMAVSFIVGTDTGLPTSFYLDSLSLVARTCG